MNKNRHFSQSPLLKDANAVWKIVPKLSCDLTLPTPMMSVQKDDSVDLPVEHAIAFNHLGDSLMMWIKIKIEK